MSKSWGKSENVGTHDKNPAEITLYLICKCLKQVHCFEKLASLMWHNLILLHRQILMMRLESTILPKDEGLLDESLLIDESALLCN